jgi:hypothetical protein
MSDALDQLKEGFADVLSELQPDLVIDLDRDTARSIGRQAARSILAPLILAAQLGETLDTAAVTDRLGLSRQALAKRLAAGTILGVRGRGTTHYPVWQFTPRLDEVRPELREVFKIFSTELGSLDPYAVAAWLKTPAEELNGLSPHLWLNAKDDPQPVYDAARQTAGRLAS